MTGEAAPIAVVLACDYTLIGDGLQSLLTGGEEVVVSARVSDPGQLRAGLRERRPDALILCTLAASGATVALVEAAQQARVEDPDLPIVVIFDGGPGVALQLLGTGTGGTAFLLAGRLSGVAGVVDALREVCAGHSVLDAGVVDALVRGHDGISIADLTARELDVLAQIAHGLSNRAVAASLGVSAKAVENHVTAIFRKLGLTDHPDLDRRVTAVLAFQHARAASRTGRGGGAAAPAAADPPDRRPARPGAEAAPR